MIDLLITHDDLTLNDNAEPMLTPTLVACIAQDIRHMIREKGYGVRLVAEMERSSRANLMKQIEIEMEEDTRLKPGTATVSYIGDGVYQCAAQTTAGEDIITRLGGHDVN